MESSKIIVGFDGGGSTSRFLVRRGFEEAQLNEFDLNLKYPDIGIAASAKGFAECLKEILSADVSQISAMCISLSGASNEASNKELDDALRSELHLPNLKLHIEGDSSFTLATAYPYDTSGILLIAGTGSVAIAKKKDGEVVKIGGWGRLLGDEGSGYWIGLQALKHYCKVMDGIESAGDLFAAIGEELHAEAAADLSPLRSKLYRDQIKPQNYAPLVFEALANDAVAEVILLEAAADLTTLIQTLWEKVEDDCERIVTLHGGIARLPFIGFHINANCDSPGFKFEILDENAPLERALEICMSLDSED